MSIYDFEVKDGEGNTVSLSQYKDKVLLIVNSATKCGFTPQYTQLNEIYNEFKDEGFEILDFPCNQFGKQAQEQPKRSPKSAAQNGWCHTQSSTRLRSTARTPILCMSTLKKSSLSQTSPERVQPS